MVESYGSDKQAKDISRVLRVPGFLHRKDPTAPHVVRLVSEGGRRYTRAAIIAAFPPVIREQKTNGRTEWQSRGDDDERIRDALRSIPADDRGVWLQIGMALKSHLGERGRALWDDWSATCAAKFSDRDQRTTWRSFRKNGIGIGTLFHYAKQAGWRPRRSSTGNDPDAADAHADEQPEQEAAGGVHLEDFRAYMPMHSYIFTPCREMWPASSVNARVPPIDTADKPMQASTWLDKNRPVEQMVWTPGLPMLIEGRLMADGGWFDRSGVTCFNLYRPPSIEHGNAAEAGPWIEHAHKVFGADAEHIVMWLAHRVQRPQDKINHALVLGGAQGIGKDTLLEPVKVAIGPWNFREVSPQQMLGRFNGFLKAVILRISEARDLGDINRYQFYDHSKAYTAAPPDVLLCDEKHLREHSVINCCGVIITTNHKTDGIYLPGDDRRHFVAWSDLTKVDFTDDYWNTLWSWYANGGIRHVAAYLAKLDNSGFDPKAPPPKTPAFWAIVDAGRAPEDAELADVLDQLGNPDATTLIQIANVASGDFELWIRDRKNRRVIPHRLEACGYVPVRNEAATDGLWKVHGKRQAIYARATLTVRDRLLAASGLTGSSE